MTARPDLRGRWEAAMVPNYPTPRLELGSGRGSRVTDAKGREYIDLLAGIAVSVVGHGHPGLAEAVCGQVRRLAHTSNLYANGPALRLAERLQALTGGHRALLVNSGTEANEAALKLVRRHAHATGRPDAVAIAFAGSFHGRTLGALALTGQPHHQAGFDPLPGQILHVPFNDPAALEAAFAKQQVAGVFAEAVQGEGGVIPMDEETASTLQRLCQAHDAPLVCDEVQTGLGRTGRNFAYEHHGLRPDVVTLAKALGGGLPIGACMVAPRLAGLLGPGAHGCTFGGNAVAAAAAHAVLDAMESERLPERAVRLGAAFTAALTKRGVPVRGPGLLLGIPLGAPRAADVVRELEGQGFLVGQAGKDVVRIAPPLTVPEEDLMAAVGPLADAVLALESVATG